MSSPDTRRTEPSVRRCNPPTIWDMTANGFSQISVSEAGRLAFLSGQIGQGVDGAALPPDIAGQAKIVAANLAAALDALGASPDDIVTLRMYVTDATTERFQRALAGLRGMLGEAMPSITTIGVQALFTPAMQLEVEAVIRVP